MSLWGFAAWGCGPITTLVVARPGYILCDKPLLFLEFFANFCSRKARVGPFFIISERRWLMTETNPSSNPSTNPPWMDRVEKMAQDVAAQEGCILYDIEFVGIGKGRTLRVFIDKEVPLGAVDSEEPGGVGIDDCSKVSRALDTLLDENDVIPGETYYLEVSTPGLDRWLRRPWHFEKAVGRKIWVKTTGSFENYGVVDKKLKNAKQIEDVLKSFDGKKLNFKVKDMEVNIPLSAIEKSKIVFELTKGQKK